MQIFTLGGFSHAQFFPMIYLNQRKLSAAVINCMQWSTDSQLLATGGEDKVIRVFSARFQFMNMSLIRMMQRYALVSTAFCDDDYDVSKIRC